MTRFQLICSTEGSALVAKGGAEMAAFSAESRAPKPKPAAAAAAAASQPKAAAAAAAPAPCRDPTAWDFLPCLHNFFILNQPPQRHATPSSSESRLH